MSATDITVLDQILSQKHALLASDMEDDEYFELFAAQHVLRSFQLDPEELQSGLVAGGDDGGIDGFYLIVNGRLIRETDDAEDLKLLKQNVVIDLIIIQASREDGFKLKRLVRLKDTSEDIFTLDRKKVDFAEQYNTELMQGIERFKIAHKVLATKYPTINVSYFYVTKGDKSEIARSVSRKGDAIEGSAKSCLATVTSCSMTFVGARELIERKRLRNPS